MIKEFNLIKFNQDYDKMKEKKILQRKLKEKSKLNKMNQTISEKKIHEMSILEIFIELKNTFFNILNDLIKLNFNSVETFFQIFYKKNRLFYIGLFLIIVTIIIYLFIGDESKKNKNIYNIYNSFSNYKKPILNENIPNNLPNNMNNLNQENPIDDIVIAEMNED